MKSFDVPGPEGSISLLISPDGVFVAFLAEKPRKE